jgi:riboflavin kinase/FMN adenylyltransferase
MKVIRGLDVGELAQVPPRRVVALGSFDGVHRGHQVVAAACVERAASQNGVVLAVTYEPHPLAVLGREHGPFLLTPLDEKIELLAGLGIDAVVVIEFSQALAQMEAAVYARSIVFSTLQPSEVIVGANHGFGRGRSGTPALLEALGSERGVRVVRMGAESALGDSISASRTRLLLRAGEVEEARTLLGRPYRLTGTVIRGEERGRRLGFPTANLELAHPQKLLPQNGVYAVGIETGGERHWGVMNIGVRPTFGERYRIAEIHVGDFEADLYGAALKADVLARLRDERRFPNIEALRAQIEMDVARARDLSGSARLTSRARGRDTGVAR